MTEVEEMDDGTKTGGKEAEKIADETERAILKAYPQFHPDAVREFSENPEKFKKKRGYNLRHYSQLVTDFSALEKLLERLGINPNNLTITVFGGYTGELARALRKLGARVIFTDPIRAYVNRAREDGFCAHRCCLENMPPHLLRQADLVSTFECYLPLAIPDVLSQYTVIKTLTRPLGLLFFESKRTRDEMDAEPGGGDHRIKSELSIYREVYSTNITYREDRGTGLRAYHFHQEEGKNRRAILADMYTIKFLYTHYDMPRQDDAESRDAGLAGIPEEKFIEVNAHTASEIARRSGAPPYPKMSRAQAISSIKRVVKLNPLREVPFLSSTRVFHIDEKVFKVAREVLDADNGEGENRCLQEGSKHTR